MRDRSHDHDRAQKWASIFVGAAVIGLIGYLTIEQTSLPKIKRDLDGGRGDAATTEDAAATIATTASATPPTEDLDAGPTLTSLFALSDASGLGSTAPRHVKLGVVLVQFAGAEGAPANARKKAEALTIAQRLADEAKADFHKAVTSGDHGSASDIGRIPRGVLDPRTEVAVFGLSAGEISEVLETPRGYWIVKRIE